MSRPGKLPAVGTTIFTVMTELCARHGAINLAQGFPDFEPPPLLRDRVAYHVQNGHNQYAPMHGVAALREAIAQQFLRSHQVSLNIDTEITVTSGATEALFSATMALVGSGDEVIVLDPAFDSYDPAIRLAGATPIHVSLHNGDFSIDFQALHDAISPRTRMIVINSPHNPSATVLSATDLDQLADIVEETGCLILSDEVYEHIVFDGIKHCSVVAHARLRAHSVAVFSFGKTFHATGWKIGYAVAPPSLTHELRKTHQYNTFTTATPLQWALADFLAANPDFPATLASLYTAKRDLFAEAMQRSSFELAPSHGSYFQLATYDAHSDESDQAFARRLTEEVGVAVIPVSVFYAQPPTTQWIRFCFAKEDDTLLQAADRLSRLQPKS